jgi:predicted CoA-binding protein
MGKVVVLGASPDQERYSYKAVKSLKKRNYDVVAVGNQPGDIMGEVNPHGRTSC